MRAIVFSDIQIHSYKNFNTGNSRLTNCLDCLEMIFAYARKKEVDVLLFPGDFFDMQKLLPIAVINHTVDRLISLFDRYPEMIMYMVSGNHDYGTQKLLGKPVETSLHFLSQIFPDHMILMDDIWVETSGIRLYGLPYYEYSEHYYQQLESFEVDPKEFNILLTHATAMGYSNIPGVIDPHHEAFKKFDLVLSGDIHKKSWLADNFLMSGICMHRDAGDAGDEKGIWLLDTDLYKAATTVEAKQETVKFIPIGNKFPQYIRKKEGDELTEWEQQQYINWDPTFEETGTTTEARVQITNFNTSLKPASLIENFWKQVDNTDEELLQIGLKLVS